MGFFSDLFGGGDSVASTSHSTTNVTVNPSVQVTTDTAAMGAALVDAAKMSSDAQVKAAEANAAAIIALTLGRAAEQEKYSASIADANDSRSKADNINLIVAICTIAALFWHQSSKKR